MISPIEEEMICYGPQEPVKWDRPADDEELKDWLESGYIDEQGNPTLLGKKEIDMCREKIDGTESEEHFQMRMKIYRKQYMIFLDWLDKRWGMGKYATGTGEDLPKDIPFPRKKMDAVRERFERKFEEAKMTKGKGGKRNNASI